MTTAHKLLKPVNTTQAMTKPLRKEKPASDLLTAVHATVAGLHRAGVVKTATMRDFDALCLMPVATLAPAG